jgi:hypothetical protein
MVLAREGHVGLIVFGTVLALITTLTRHSFGFQAALIAPSG